MLKIIFVLCTFLSNPLFADPFTEANHSYDQGDFNKAAILYEEMIKGGTVNGSVYYNLANSYFRLGEKGKAVAAYLAARRLLPRDPDIRANLKFAHEQMVDKLSIRSEESVLRDLAFWIDATSPKELLFLSSLLICLALSFLFLSLVVKNLSFLRVWSLTFSIVAFLGFSAFATSLYFDQTWGAVTASLTEVRSGPGELNTVVFQLHEGAPFVVEDVQSSWYRISLSDGKTGWLASKDASVYFF